MIRHWKVTLVCLVLGLVVLGLRTIDRSDEPAESERGRTEAAVPGAVIQGPAVGFEPGERTTQAPGVRASRNGVTSAPTRVVASRWLDPAQKAFRQRVRIVREDFKYPLLRKVEEVSIDPITGEERVRLITASVADHVLVGLKKGVDEKKAREELQERGFWTRATEPGSFLLVEVANAEEIEAQEAAIEALAALNEFINFSEPDYLVFPSVLPDDPSFLAGQLWGLDNPGTIAGSTLDADIDAPEGWSVRTDASAVVVAVTDTGIRFTHEDLVSNLWSNPGETPGDGVDNDGNGVIDDVHGFDAQNNDGDPSDDNGHGTHVAGTIGAQGNNATGSTGVAWDVQLMGVKFLSGAGGSTSDAIRAVNYARLHGADLINASWGGAGASEGLYNAIEACAAEGILFVAAAGNYTADNDSRPFYPSSYDLPNVVAVASTNRNDRLSTFSNRGQFSVDLAAPGSDIQSTFHLSDRDYRLLNGTSMAAPHVSGALALAHAEFSGEGADDLRARLISSVDPVDALRGEVATGGRLNLGRLMAASNPVPGHDQFEDALRFEGSYGFWSGSNRRATREPDEDAFSVAGTGARTLWFGWEAPFGGLLEIEVRAKSGLANAVLFRGAARDALQVAASSSGALSTVRKIRLYVEAGAEYRLVVGSDEPEGQNLNVSLDLIASNDNLASAEALAGESFTASGSNRRATMESFELERPHAGVGRGHSVWWKWTPDFDGDFVITTTGSGFDTVLAVYSGDPSNPAGFTELASNDDRNRLDWTSQVEFPVRSGTTYYLAVDSYRANDWGEILLSGFKLEQIMILRPPASQAARLGGRAEFSVVVLGGGDLEYLWYFNGEVIPGQGRANLVIDPVGTGSFGNYEVEIFNQVGSVRSAVATLSLERSAPQVVWSTGNVAAVTGDPVRLEINALGSEPLTYEWRRDGSVIPGAIAQVYEIPSIAAGEAGLYECEVSNDRGAAVATMAVTVVASPIDGWEWRREAVPNATITDMEVVDGKVYAVSGNRILVSDNGEDWLPWRLPAGFEGVSLLKWGSQWICAGSSATLGSSVTFSNDGVTWTPPRATVVVGEPTFRGPVGQMEVIGSKIVMRASVAGEPSGWVCHSSDGVTWIKATRRTLPGPQVPFESEARMVKAFGKLYLPGGPYSDSVIETSDGITWTDVWIPESFDLESIALLGDKLYAFGFGGLEVFESLDGSTWTQTVMENPSQFWRPQSMGYQLAGGVLALCKDQRYCWGPDLGSMSMHILIPATANHHFTASVLFNGRVVYGTTSGVLASISDPSEFEVTTEDTEPLEELVFLHDEFFASTVGRPYSEMEPILISGDGKNWRTSRDMGFTGEFSPRVFLNGRYLGGDPGVNDAAAGWAPGAMSEEQLGSVPGVVVSMASDGATTLAVASPSIWSVDANGENWTALRQGNGNSRLHFLKGRWFLTNTAGFPWALLETSLDGTNWSSVPGVFGNHLVELGDALYAIEHELDQVWRSFDGVNWTELAVTLPAGWDIGSDVTKAVRFEDSILVLTDRGSLVFSTNGTTWFRVPAPLQLKDIAVGKGQVVALTNNGGVVQAGRSHPGGGAPRVDLVYPANLSVHWSGNLVEISGTAVDPEGDLAEVECVVDGTSIGVTANGAFSFNFEAGAATNHVVVIRATDRDGLVGSDDILIEVAPPEITNLLGSEEGRLFLPDVAWVEFGGAYYAGGERAVFRSRDGIAWERIPIPIGDRNLTAMVTGNDSLVLQFSDAALAATRDGVNWTQFRPGPWTIIEAPLSFTEGWFGGTVRSSTFGQNVSYHSEDGLRWTVSAVGGGYHSEIIFLDDGVALGLTAGGTGVFRSLDGGSNWVQIEELGTTHPDETALVAGEGVLVVGKQEGAIYHSNDHGETWTLAQMVDPVSEDLGEMTGAYHAGLFFLGVGEDWLYVSDDGVSWQSITGGPLRSSRVVIFGGRYLGSGFDGMLWSSDGVGWEPVITGPGATARDTLTATSDQALVVDALGAAWSTGDGMNWERAIPGRPLDDNIGAINAPQRIRFVRNIGDRLVAGGRSGILWYSDDEGRSWEPGSLSGAPLETRWTFSDLAIGSDTLVAVGSSRFSSDIFRSSDGATWTRLRALQTARIVDVEANGSEFVAVAADGKIWRSIDDGETWTEQPALDGLAASHTLLRFDGIWIVLGQAGSFGRYAINSYFSPDGVQWTNAGPVGGPDALSNNVAVAEGADRLVVALDDGTILSAADRQLQWTTVADLDRSISEVTVQYQAGRFFLARLGGDVLYEAADVIEATSLDGLTWEPIAWGIKMPVVENGGVFVSGGGWHWSLDAVNWVEADTESDSFRGIDGELLVPLGGGFHGYTVNGEEWSSADGRSWTQAGPGPPGNLERSVVNNLVRFGATLVAGGSQGLLNYSRDNGSTWLRGMIDGQLLPATWDVHRLEVGQNLIRAVLWGYDNQQTPRVLLSVDGMNWELEEQFEAERVVDFGVEGAEWLVAGFDGSVRRSLDHGTTWTPVAIPGLQLAREILRFEDRWIVFGAQDGGDDEGYAAFSSADGLTWSNDGLLGTTSNPFVPLFRIAHGELIFGSSRPFQVTTDGMNWAEMQPYSPYQGIQLVEVQGGLLAVTALGADRFGMKFLPFGAPDWIQIEPYQDGVSNAISLEGRLFLSGNGTFKEWTEFDVVLEADDLAPVTLGVGDELSATATLRNRGLGELVEGDYTVEAWLSADGFFGDLNDVRVGIDTVRVGALMPGEEAALSLGFELPESVPVGMNHLILIFDSEATLVELNRANNVSIQSAATVEVPQFELNLVTNGDGEVEQDFVARFYPQGAGVSLSAKAGKGSTFAGWGGDAVGGLSQVTVLMTGDLTVEANFIPIASLQVFVRGAGTVSGESDTGTYEVGDMVALTAATAVPGWEFAGWSGNASGTAADVEVTVDSPQVVTARFILPLDSWRSMHFSPAELLNAEVSGDGADPDGDGLTNRYEYMHASDPRDRTSRGAEPVQVQGGYLTRVFTRLQGMDPGFVLRARGSRDHENWEAPDFEERILDVRAGIETVEARLPMEGHPKGFLRFEYR